MATTSLDKDFCHLMTVHFSTPGTYQEKFWPLIFLRSQTWTTHSERAMLWQHQLCCCCSRGTARGQGTPHPVSHWTTEDTGPQKHHCPAEGASPKHADCPECYCFHELHRGMTGHTSIRLSLYLPCCPQHLASHMPSCWSCFEEQKVSGSNLTGKVTLRP